MSRTRRMAVRNGKRVQWWEDDATGLPDRDPIPEPPPPPPTDIKPCPNGCPIEERFRDGSGRLRCRVCHARQEAQRKRMRRVAARIATAAVAA